MSRQPLRWYARRLARMSAAELAWRTRDRLRQTGWSARQVRPGEIPTTPPPALSDRSFPGVLPADAGWAIPEPARRALLETADGILAGRLDVLGVIRTDLRSPDWFVDPVTGQRSAPDLYAFRINHRDEDDTGNVKQVWELSRHHHLTLLSAAWFLTGKDEYAQLVADQLESWWQQNPFLSGIHWTNGIEVGIRLISWTWIRRLLATWPPVSDLFEHNPLALRQLHWHQRYLAAFRSRGSSANNHVLAEAAGQLVAATAFPWFGESAGWRSDAAALLETELANNTFPDGLNRELASDYHRFVAELALLAAVEADAAGTPLSEDTWDLLAGMFDSAAALVDETGRPPRQGDSDEGRALVLDPPEPDRWFSLLALGGAAIGSLHWWPATAPDARSALVEAMPGRNRQLSGRPERRPSHFEAAGVTLLRTVDRGRPEIWCRCDGGPHGFLAIAAHAHADALSLEVRVGGVDVLADPGTYCYHGEEPWRTYFRSTLGHNTVELAGQNQSVAGGAFLWLRHANGRVLAAPACGAGGGPAGDPVWSAEHDGYRELHPPAVHRRSVRLDRARRTLRVEDRIDSAADVSLRMAYHLGPEVGVELVGNAGQLTWPTAAGSAHATVRLPAELRWTQHRGETGPILGWYSSRLGQRVPATTLIGSGPARPPTRLVTEFDFPD